MSRTKELLKMVRMYREETGITDIDHHDVARWAKQRGWKLPTPKDPVDLLADELSAAARTETRIDAQMGFAYRANHAYQLTIDGKLKTRWVDVDERVPRKKMAKCLTIRRNQMAADGIQLSFDALHWNNVNPTEEPLKPPMDFTFDVQMALAALENDRKKKAS